MDCTVHGVAKSKTRLSDFQFHISAPASAFTGSTLFHLNYGSNILMSLIAVLSHSVLSDSL